MDASEYAQKLDRIGKRLREVSIPIALGYTIPVCAVYEGGVPIPHGTGVLLQIEDCRFLLSCAHVLGEVKKDAALGTVGADHSPLVDFAKVEYFWTEDEHIDLGFALLSDYVISRLPPDKKFVDISLLDLERSCRAGFYSVVGYPVELTERQIDQRHTEWSPLSVTGFLLNGQVQNHIDDITIAMEFEPNAIGDSDGNLARVPSLKGISGCGIWRLAVIDGSTRPDYSGNAMRLVGIEHTVQKHSVHGSNVAELMYMIGAEFPRLRASIALHARGI